MGTGSLVEIAPRWGADAAGLVVVTVVGVGVAGLPAQTITGSRVVVVMEKVMEKTGEEMKETGGDGGGGGGGGGSGCSRCGSGCGGCGECSALFGRCDRMS